MPTSKKSVDDNSDSSEQFFEQPVSLPSLDPFSLLCHPQGSVPPQSPLAGIFEIEHTNHNNISSLNRDNFNHEQQQEEEINIVSKSVSIMNTVDTTTTAATASSTMKIPIVLNTGSLSITPVTIPTSSSSVSSSSNQENKSNKNNITPPPPLVGTSVYNNNNNNNNKNSDNNNNESGRENIWTNQEQQQLLPMTSHHQYEHQIDQQQLLSNINSSAERNSPPSSPSEPQSKKAFIIENIDEDSEMSEPYPDSTACDHPNSNNSTNFTVNSTGQTNNVQFSSGTMGSNGEDNVDMACSFMQKDSSLLRNNSSTLPNLSYGRQAYSLHSHSPHMQITQNYFGYSGQLQQQQQQPVNTNANNSNNIQQTQFGSISNVSPGWQQQQQLQHEQLRGRNYHNFLNMEDVDREKISSQQEQLNHHPPPIPQAFQNSHSHNVSHPLSQNHLYNYHHQHHHHHQNRQVQPLPTPHIMQQRQTNFNPQQQQQLQQGAELNSIENLDLKPIISPQSLPPSPWYPEPYPGGLEHLFKEIPVECQTLIIRSDIPDTARSRGYFTVCELLQLKRQVLDRHRQRPSEYTYTALSTAEEARQAALRAENVKNFSSTIPNNNNSTDKNSNTENLSSEVEGTANQVKGALDILNDDDDQLFHEEQIQQQSLLASQRQHQHHADNQQQKLDSWTSREIPNIQSSSNCSIRSSSCSSTTDINSHGSPYSPVLTIDERPQQHLYNQQQQPMSYQASLQQRQQQHHQQQLNRRSLPQLTPMPLDRDGREHISVTPDIKYLSNFPTTPSPPINTNPLPPTYRTQTLVVKLLQIGNYNFRSFSDEPNKLKVQFNAQKISYECQLPHEYHAKHDLPRGQKTPLRKVLTIEIGFDQITKMRFQTGKMELRVDGKPLLNCQYFPLDDPASLQQQPTLSPEDQMLLDHISKQQLQLAVYHHVHFLNERLVQQLEGQFRDHPRFRHLLTDSEHTRMGQ